MQNTGFESDLFEGDDSADALIDASADGLADGFEDAFGEDAFEAADGFESDGFEDDAFEDDAFEEDAFEADGFEEDSFENGFEADALDEGDGFAAEDGFEAGDGFEDDAFESDAFEEDAFEAGDQDGADAIEQAFADAMDAEDEDEFVRRVWRGLRRAARVAAPVLRRIGRRALPIAMQLLRQGASRIGGVAGQELRGALGGLPGGGQPAEAMDAFADAIADEAYSEAEVDQYAPVLGGMAARFAVRNVTSRSARAGRPGQARALGRAVTRATTQATRTLVAQQGPQAVRAIPRIVRWVTITIRRRQASPRALSGLIRRTAARVAASPRAVARLARPSPAARRLRASVGARALGSRPALGRRSAARVSIRRG
jgi:hypothetical protein